jgi:glycosyltransferase involved in cell wall biosynthesis
VPYADIVALARDGPAPLLPPAPARAPLHVAVVIPPVRRGSGGHGLVLQIVAGLEARGHTCSLWHHDPGGRRADEPPAVLQRLVRESLVPVRAPLHKGFAAWRGADVVLATGWETAYAALRLPGCRARAYLVSDHEPSFYAASAEAEWAARTYRLGLRCLAASPWLADLLRERYGAEADAYQLGVDQAVYHPGPGTPRAPATIAFYARAVTPRRAVPLGALALAEVRRRRPDVRVVVYGDREPAPELAFPVESLGVASPARLAQLYREATVGLSLSLTNFSLVPKEMLACGLPCVELAGISAESIFPPPSPLALAPPDHVALADALLALLADPAERERRAAAGLRAVQGHTWAAAAERVEAALRRLVDGDH